MSEQHFQLQREGPLTTDQGPGQEHEMVEGAGACWRQNCSFSSRVINVKMLNKHSASAPPVSPPLHSAVLIKSCQQPHRSYPCPSTIHHFKL